MSCVTGTGSSAQVSWRCGQDVWHSGAEGSRTLCCVVGVGVAVDAELLDRGVVGFFKAFCIVRVPDGYTHKGLHPPVHFPHAYHSQGWARARNYIWICPVDGRDSSTQALPTASWVHQ